MHVYSDSHVNEEQEDGSCQMSDINDTRRTRGTHKLNNTKHSRFVPATAVLSPRARPNRATTCAATKNIRNHSAPDLAEESVSRAFDNLTQGPNVALPNNHTRQFANLRVLTAAIFPGMAAETVRLAASLSAAVAEAAGPHVPPTQAHPQGLEHGVALHDKHQAAATTAPAATPATTAAAPDANDGCVDVVRIALRIAARHSLPPTPAVLLALVPAALTLMAHRAARLAAFGGAARMPVTDGPASVADGPCACGGVCAAAVGDVSAAARAEAESGPVCPWTQRFALVHEAMTTAPSAWGCVFDTVPLRGQQQQQPQQQQQQQVQRLVPLALEDNVAPPRALAHAQAQAQHQHAEGQAQAHGHNLEPRQARGPEPDLAGARRQLYPGAAVAPLRTGGGGGAVSGGIALVQQRLQDAAAAESTSVMVARVIIEEEAARAADRARRRLERRAERVRRGRPWGRTVAMGAYGMYGNVFNGKFTT